MLKEPIETDADELEVQDVRCSVTGVPIPAIPHWYARVKVNFVSDHARGKGAPVPVAPGEDEESEEESEEATEVSLEDVDEDLVAEEMEIEIGDDVADIDEE